MSNFANHSRFMVKPDHSNVTYLKQDEIGPVLAQALADLYKSQPKNQLQFLGNWLLNFSKSSSNKKREQELEDIKENLREKLSKSKQDERLLQEQILMESQKLLEGDENLRGRIQKSVDVDDFLNELVNYLKEQTQATGCYIGQLERVKKPVGALDSESAHIDDSGALVIRYISASAGTEFIIDHILAESEGEVTFSVWKEEEPVVDDSDEVNESVLTTKKEKKKYVYIPDVLNEPKIKFFDVPKLGCYFVVPLTYKSCLFESSFDAAVDDALDCRKLRAQQEEEKQKSDHLSNKEEEEEKVFEEIIEAPYKVKEIKFVVALDTLGQDRQFTDEEKQKILNWVEFFANEWERAENQSMKKDVLAHITQSLKDQIKINEKQHDWAEEEKNLIEETYRNLDPNMLDDLKYIESQSALLELYRRRIIEDFPVLLDFSNYHLVKFGKVFKIAFYLIGVDREAIIEPRTNCISWKKGKKYLNNKLRDFLVSVKARGPKSIKPEAYAKTLFLEKDLLSVNIEDVQHYSLALANLYRFLEQYFKVRALDVNYRRKIYFGKVDDRENAIRIAQELADRRKKYIEEAKENFDRELEAVDDEASKPVFDESRLLQEFDEMESNKTVEIPPQIVCDDDFDIDFGEGDRS